MSKKMKKHRHYYGKDGEQACNVVTGYKNVYVANSAVKFAVKCGRYKYNLNADYTKPNEKSTKPLIKLEDAFENMGPQLLRDMLGKAFS